MPSKTEEYLALAKRTANGLTRYWESWTDYLTTASRLYKYPFADQLMIYAQRPDATACAEFDIWRNRMNRYVRRGSKGIALLDESSGFPRLHYVFDVSDTGVRRNSRDPEMWQYNDDLKQPVSEMLSKTYGISGERVSQQLADVAGKLVADYWDNNGGDIRAIVDGSLLMDYDEAGVEMQFKSAAAISVTYTLLERCGFEPAGWFDKDDFQAIHEFSTPDSVYALGAAVSDMSREVLRNIERTVKTTIRRRNNERSQHEYEQQSELHADRGLSSPEPDPASAEDPAGQVRQDAPELSEAAASGTVQHDAPVGEPVPAPDGSGADGREPDAADHGAASETDPGPGKGEPADGVGATHEQPESAGRGTGADGADLQLSFFDAHIPTEAEQIETIDRAESEKAPSAFVLSQAEIENELRKHGSGFAGGKQRIMALYQTQPDRNLRAKVLAKEYGIGGHSHDFLDGSRGFVNHDWKGLEFDHYPDHQKITLKWAQVEKYIDLMIQSDRYLTDKEKEHYTPPVSAEPDATLTHAKNLIREFCQEEYDSEPDFSDLSKIGVAYTNVTDEDIPIQVNVDLVGYRVERYLGEVLIDERQYESLEELTETELEALDFSELVSVTDEELEHYHNKAEEHPALLPLDAATEYNALKEQHPDALVGFEQGGQFEFYGEDARKVCELLSGKFLEKETALGTVPVISFPRDQWAYRAKQLWQRGETVYLAGLNEDGTHYQTKYLRREDYLPLGDIVHMEGRAFRVDTVNFDKGSVSLQDVALAEMRIPVFREEPLALVRELYEEQDMMESPLPDYKVGDNVIVDLPTRTIEGKIGYVGETDVRIDTSAQGQSWDNEVINKRQFEDVEKMSAEFTELIANPPKVSYRDGHYFVFDGQHTIVTRRAMNGGQDLPIICKVYEGLTEEDEAMLFSRQTGVSTPLTAGAELRAALVGKDPESLAFVKATESTGLQLGLDSYRAPWKIICIRTAFKEYKAYGADLYKEALTMLAKGWEGDPDSLRSGILRGMVRFVALYQGEYDPERLVKRLQTIHPMTLVRDEKSLSGTVSYKYMMLILRTYNGASRRFNLPIKQ